MYQAVDKAMAKHKDVDTVVNFASSRSVYSSTMDLMRFDQIKCIAIIAEGVPERVSAWRSVACAVGLTLAPTSVPERSSTSPRRRASPSLALLPLVVSGPVRSRSVTLAV